MPSKPLKRTAEWHLSEAVDWRPRAIFWRNLRKTPWYAWPMLMGFLALVVFITLNNSFFIAIFSGSWAYLFRLLMRKQADQRVALMSQSDSPVAQYPVDLVLYQKGVCYGQDSGIVSFCDGWMLFEGESTSFSISRDDVVVRPPQSNNGAGPDPRYLFWMDYYIEDTTYKVGIHALSKLTSVDGEVRDNLNNHFRWALDAWSKDPFRPEGQSVLPPVRPSPMGWYRVWLNQSLGQSIVLVAVMAIPLILRVGLLQRIWPFVALVLALFTLIFAWRSLKNRQVLLAMDERVLPPHIASSLDSGL